MAMNLHNFDSLVITYQKNHGVSSQQIGRTIVKCFAPTEKVFSETTYTSVSSGISGTTLGVIDLSR